MSGSARRPVFHGAHVHEAPRDARAHERPVLLELRDVSRTWRAGAGSGSVTARALRDVSLTVRAGEVLALTGAPGAGKTTLLLCAAGLARPDAGWVTGARGAEYVDGCEGWAERALAAVGGGASVLLLDVLDAPTLASPRSVAELAGDAAGQGLGVLVAARDPASLPAFATRLVTLAAGRVVGAVRPLASLLAPRRFVAERPPTP